MRVLQVSHTAQPGGSNAVLLSLARHAPAGVHAACVFLEEGSSLERALDLGVPAAVVPTGRARQPWRAPAAIRRLRGAIRSHRADLVLSHVNKAHLYAGFAARLEGVPAVWWQHEHRATKPALQRVAPHVPARAVICSAEWIAEEMRGSGRAPVHVVNPGVEPEDRDVPARDHRGRDEVVFGVVGRLARWKRAHLAVRAMPSIRRSLPRARLRILGGPGAGVDRGYDAELRAEAERLGVAEAVELVGHVADMRAERGGLDVLLHPAEREPWGLVLLEAMAAGVPVVAADEAGPREIVRDGVDGVLAPDPAGGAFAAAAVRLGSDPELRRRMGEEGRERVRSTFTAEAAAARLWGLLRTMTP